MLWTQSKRCNLYAKGYHKLHRFVNLCAVDSKIIYILSLCLLWYQDHGLYKLTGQNKMTNSLLHPLRHLASLQCLSGHQKVGLYMSTFSKPVHMYTACLNQSAQISVVQINLGSRLDTRWILKILKKCIWISWKCWGTPHPKKYFNLGSKCNCSDRIWASDYECALQDLVGIKILHNQIPLLSHRD